MERNPSPYLEIRRSRIHGRGAFAKRTIPRGTRIIEYVGEKISKKEAERRIAGSLRRHRRDPRKGSLYVFEVTRTWDIDGDVPWNTAKWINHSCSPNCFVEIERGRVWIIAARRIRKGEELTYDYGCPAEDYKNYPCRCGAPNCVGYIVAEEERPRLRRMLERQNGRSRRRRNGRLA